MSQAPCASAALSGAAQSAGGREITVPYVAVDWRHQKATGEIRYIAVGPPNVSTSLTHSYYD